MKVPKLTAVEPHEQDEVDKVVIAGTIEGDGAAAGVCLLFVCQC